MSLPRPMSLRWLVSLVGLLAPACSPAAGVTADGGDGVDAVTEGNPDAGADADSPVGPDGGAGSCGTVQMFAAPVVAGTVANAAIVEASGLGQSWNTPNTLFVHNDSGDSPRFFAIHT